ncbi:hypothetical protein TB1_032619 [Malus domestica]
MNFKRHLSGEDGKEFEFPVPEPKRRLTLTNVLRDAMTDARLNGVLERSFQRIVRDELERRILPSFMASPRPSNESGSTSGGSGLQLRFINKLPTTIFTGSRVKAENGEPLQIELVDASTGAIVHSGPLSSLKVELFVLNGEFGSDDQEDWTEKELNTYIVREREGKRPLVTGDIHVTLREGVGSFGDVMFTDNSSWIRCRRFRLAARVVAKAPIEVRIREATSEPLVVREHRGKLYMKHHPPHPNDEIWLLEKISKDGASHKRLYENGISTVEDFLQSYMKDASSLRNVLRGISNKIWDTIVEHAMACKLDDHKFYAYHRAEQDVISLIFNSIHGLVGAIINGEFCSLDGLDSHQKMRVEALKQQAYRNVRDLVPIDASTIFGLSKPLPVPQADSFACPNPDMQQVEFQLTHQVYKKHHPPHPNDEIWRLEKISKDGAFHKRLYEKGISTVEDFLQSYMKDASSLRNVLRGISNKIWDTIVQHAMACKLDDRKFYAYHIAEQDVSLMFNSIHGLEGAIINGQFCSLYELDSNQKMLVEALKQQAYRNVRDLVPIDASTMFSLSKLLPVLQADSFTCPNPDLRQSEFQLTHQDGLPIQLGFNHASNSTSCPYQAEGSSNQLVVSVAQPSEPIHLRSSSFSMEDLSSIIDNGESSWPPVDSFQAPIVPTGHLGTECKT